jgi:mannobiose 2-epimerase
MFKHRFHFMLVLCGLLLLSPMAHAQDAAMKSLQKQVHEQMLAHLELWYPRCVDKDHGGFHATFDYDQKPLPDQTRGLVFQSRMTWVAAMAAEHLPQKAEMLKPIIRHGVAMLRDVMQDQNDGSFYWELTADNKPGDTWQQQHKHAYGISFALYALAQAYYATGDTDALKLAQDNFRWLDEHAHDATNGGYHETMQMDGTPIPTPADVNVNPKWDHIGTLLGDKSMNTHIHLLESFGALRQVWNDPILDARFRELFEIVREKIYVEPGCLNQIFTPNWRAVPTGDSFGHDIETAYLLTESAALLGMPEDTRTWLVARNLVDHALAFGFDGNVGGFYDEGSAHKPAHNKTKYWWVQAEGLNALSIMNQRFGNQTPRYRNALLKLWDFITQYQLDSEFGGWRNKVLPDNTIPAPADKKGHNWKGAYHTFRALLLTDQRLLQPAKSSASH